MTALSLASETLLKPFCEALQLPEVCVGNSTRVLQALGTSPSTVLNTGNRRSKVKAVWMCSIHSSWHQAGQYCCPCGGRIRAFGQQGGWAFPPSTLLSSILPAGLGKPLPRVMARQRYCCWRAYLFGVELGILCIPTSWWRIQICFQAHWFPGFSPFPVLVLPL